MSRFLFVTWNGGGNLTPALGIARKLAEHSHDVAFVGEETQGQRIEAAGFDFTAFAPFAEPAAVPDAAERLSRLIRGTWMNTDLGDDVLALLAREPADVVVVDCMLAGVLAMSSKFDARTVVLVHGLFESVRPMRDAMLAMGNQLRVAAGLPALEVDTMLWERKDLVLVTTLREFDGAAADPGATVRYVGPVFDWSPPPDGWHLPWGDSDPRPLVLVSTSTMPGQSFPGHLQLLLDALGTLPIRVLLTSGAVSPELLTPPANAAVFGFVPHAAVLRHAALSINHAGHGSVMAALAHGVPCLCIPGVGADQSVIARRVEELGAGRALNNPATLEAIRTPVTEMLDDPACRSSARRLEVLIRREDGAANGAGILESYAGHANLTVNQAASAGSVTGRRS